MFKPMPNLAAKVASSGGGTMSDRRVVLERLRPSCYPADNLCHAAIFSSISSTSAGRSL